MTVPHNDRIDLVIQFALLTAGEEDEYALRDLGPIHLIKYVYLADLVYADKNYGETFTGSPWRFYKFGPWSEAVYERVEPAAVAIGAEVKRFRSDYKDNEDWVRFLKCDDRLLRERESALPLTITARLHRYIHEFGKDTAGLLDYVYTTRPMLRAAPNEILDFSPDAAEVSVTREHEDGLRIGGLSEKKRKRVAERIRSIAERHAERARQQPRMVNPVSNARYDDVYAAGISWLDRLAGEPLPEGELTAEFSPEVWKSPARGGDDVA